MNSNIGATIVHVAKRGVACATRPIGTSLPSCREVVRNSSESRRGDAGLSIAVSIFMRKRDSSITTLCFKCFHLEGCVGDFAPVEVVLTNTRSRMRAFTYRR
ncbi:MAG TPA: hypothetical protein VGG28_32710 [Kofleriaceae bacterium]|jgi:hypothetical protein